MWDNTETLEKLANSLYPRDMTHDEQIDERRRIVAFWKVYGLSATKDAFGVSRATLFRWQQDPAPKSRAHIGSYAKRQIPEVLAEEINRVRTLHPHLGKEKLTPLLEAFCQARGLPVWSEPTIGRVLTQLKAEGRLKSPVRLRLNARTGKLEERTPEKRQPKARRGSYLPEHPGDLLQLDGVLKINLGRRRYVFTAVDLVARVAWARAYSTASSRNGRDFLEHILTSTPFPIAHIQTDNGSEFLKEFRVAAVEAELVQFFNWVKQPKYQGWVERFNRTIQEEFLDWNLALLADDINLFNQKLTEWIGWYNSERVHRGLNQKTAQGVQKYTPLQYLSLHVQSQTG